MLMLAVRAYVHVGCSKGLAQGLDDLVHLSQYINTAHFAVNIMCVHVEVIHYMTL